MWKDFFEGVGILQKNSNGEYVIPFPGAGKAMQMLLGTDVKIDATIPIESFLGLLPAPSLAPGSSPYQGMLPQLGAPSAFVLGLVRSKYGGVFEDAADMFAQYGTDTSLGPRSLDNLLAMFGVTGPWMTNSTRKYMEATQQWAVIDGLRMEIADNPPPEPPANLAEMSAKERQKWVDQWNIWAEHSLANAEHKASVMYGVRAFNGAFLPFNVQFDPQIQDDLSKVFAVFSGAEEAGLEAGAIRSVVLDNFKQAYPGAWAFMSGKTISPDLNLDPNDFEAFRQEIKAGNIDVLNPTEWLRFSYGMNSWFQMVNERSQIYRSLGDTPRDVLLQGFERRQGLSQLDDEWDNFLVLTDQVAEDEGGGRSFRVLFEEWESTRRTSGELQLSLDQEKALEAKKLLGELGNSFSPNAMGRDWGKVIGQLSELTSTVDYPRGSSPIGKAIDWWWNNVGNPYREDVDKVWDEINATPKALRAPLYQELRNIENEWDKNYKSKWGSLPSPQAVFFNNMSPQQRKLRLYEQATLPVPFLNEFYRQKLGLDGPTAKLNRLAEYIGTIDQQFDIVVASNQISTSSLEYEQMKQRVEQMKREKAKELGVSKQYELWSQPSYRRVDRAFDLSQKNGSWAAVVQDVDRIWSTLEAHDLSPRGSSQAAQTYQRWMMDKIGKLRKQDPYFNDIMSNLEMALGEDGRPLVGPDMYMKVFFEWWQDSAPLYVYTK
jgi:hypothetical protein